MPVNFAAPNWTFGSRGSFKQCTDCPDLLGSPQVCGLRRELWRNASTNTENLHLHLSIFCSLETLEGLSFPAKSFVVLFVENIKVAIWYCLYLLQLYILPKFAYLQKLTLLMCLKRVFIPVIYFNNRLK